MVDLLARSKIYVGASKTDGVSTSALEALNQGALPVQTDTSCIWQIVEHGSSGFVPKLKIGDITSAIQNAMDIVENGGPHQADRLAALRSYGSKEVARARFRFAYQLA